MSLHFREAMSDCNLISIYLLKTGHDRGVIAGVKFTTRRQFYHKNCFYFYVSVPIPRVFLSENKYNNTHNIFSL